MAHQKDGGRGCTCAVGREWSCEVLEEDEGKCHLYIEITPTTSSATSIPTTYMLPSKIWMVLERR